MTNLLAARLQMAFFLRFQMIFAQIGAALPVMVAGSEWRWPQTGDAVCLDLGGDHVSLYLYPRWCSPCALSHRGTRLHDLLWRPFRPR